MSLNKFRLSLATVTAAALLTVAVPVRADSISPTSFSATLGVGGSVTVRKTVTVDAGSASTQADILFLTDSTGSMGGAIGAVQTAANAILAGTAALGDIQWGVADYKDSGDIYTYNLAQAITPVQAAVTGAIGLWTASGGGDFAEDNLHALTVASGPTTGWRAGSQKVVVIFRDAPAHDPGSAGETLASTKAALIAAGVKVISFDVGSLNSSGQFDGAGSITADVPGSSYNVGLGGDPAATVIAAISAAFATYSSVCLDTSETPAGVTASSTACHVGMFDRSVERTFDFDLTFTGDAPGVYSFNTYGTVDGGRVATEADRIEVPEPFTLAMFGLGLAGIGFMRRRRAA